jgi:spermidine synthase
MTLLHDAPGSVHWITVHESEATRFLELDGCEEGAMDLFTEEPVFNYLWFHRASVLAGDVRRALVLGAGAFTAAKCLALAYPAADVHAVDVETQLEPIARRFFRLDQPEFARVRFHGVSAEAFLAARPAPFDFVFDDLFDGFQHVPQASRVPEHFALLRACLRPGGVCVKNLIWDAHSAGTRAACAEAMAAARASFAQCAALCLGPAHRGHNRMSIAADEMDWDRLVPRLLAAGIPATVLAGSELIFD